MSSLKETPGGRAPPGQEERTRDPITGLPNETVFHRRLPEEYSLARERENNGAVLAVMLDNLVPINRMHGRSGGDEALRAVAYLLSNYRAAPGREAHQVFKLGGPAFGYFIPACTEMQARAAAEELHRLAAESELFLERLTVSIGIVNFYEFFLEEGAPEELALRVEQTALHRMTLSEQQGGNTISDSSGISPETVADSPRVLLVDPEPSSMDLLMRALETANIQVSVRTDGESALQFLEAETPSLIICEAMTPRLDGFGVRERLQTRAAWKAIPFILVSHRKNEDLIRKAVALDIRHFFRKPVSLTEVVGLVENITRRSAR
jgi:diguanylate cyclase (GGDEF)-like protein